MLCETPRPCRTPRPCVPYGLDGGQHRERAVEAEAHVHRRTADGALECNESETAESGDQRREHIEASEPSMQPWHALADRTEQLNGPEQK
jgi:hypothetical protein